MIELINVYKTYHGKYRDVPVLKNINLRINQGDFAMMVGKSGCGKSTLLNILGSMDVATEGTYKFMGTDMNKLTDKQLALFRNQNVGFVFQSFHLIHEVSVGENIELPMGLRGAVAKRRRSRVKELLQIVGLEEKENSKPLELSGGQQQRVAIARALANQPNFLLCDEPTGNLDEESGKMVMDLLVELNRQGVTIVMVTHDKSLTKYANRIIEINNGEI